jgi:uncharacterized GH25 family protein
VAPENVSNGKLRNTFDLKLVKTGTYKIALVSQSVFGSYKDKEGNVKRFRGTEESLAKDVPADATEVKLSRTDSRLETFVTNGDASKEVFKPTGKGLELVPVTHPTELRAGEKATFRFLLDGKPAANQGVSLIPGGVKYRGTLGEIRKTTDANGELSFVLPAAGAYMVSSSWPARRRKRRASRRKCRHAARPTRPWWKSCRNKAAMRRVLLPHVISTTRRQQAA